MTTKCTNCGHFLQEEQTQDSSNSQREAVIKVPEHHWPMIKLAFKMMNTKFGMLGHGELANLMPGYEDQIPLERSQFRFFDDAAIAYTYLGMERGYRISTRIEEGGRPDYEGNARVKVFVDLDHEDAEKTITFQVSDGAPEEAAKEVCAILEDAGSRITPME